MKNPEPSTHNHTVKRSPLIHLIRAFRSLLSDFHNHTVLFRKGRVVFVTYGVLMAIAFSVGSFTALTHFESAGGDPARFIQFSALLLLPMVILGARLFSVLLEWRALFKTPLSVLVKPGFMLHGGVFGGAAAIAVASAWWGMSPVRLIDAWALGLPLGESVARIGCYVYGCCWGKETRSHMAIHYTNPNAKVLRMRPHLTGHPIYPAQLFGTALYFGLFLIAAAAWQIGSSPGLVGAIYLTLHPVLRIIHEHFREDERGRAFFGLTHTNIYSAAQMAGGLWMFYWMQTSLAPIITLSPLAATPGVSGSVVALFLGAVALIAAVVFGVHIDRVGQWLNPSPGPLTKIALHLRATPTSFETSGLHPQTVSLVDRSAGRSR